MGKNKPFSSTCRGNSSDSSGTIDNKGWRSQTQSGARRYGKNIDDLSVKIEPVLYGKKMIKKWQGFLNITGWLGERGLEAAKYRPDKVLCHHHFTKQISRGIRSGTKPNRTRNWLHSADALRKPCDTTSDLRIAVHPSRTFVTVFFLKKKTFSCA